MIETMINIDYHFDMIILIKKNVENIILIMLKVD